MQAKSFKIKMKQKHIDDCELGVSVQMKLINLTLTKFLQCTEGFGLDIKITKNSLREQF